MTVFISGTAGGIGGATARLFLEKGDIVFGVDKKESLIRHERYHFIRQDIREPLPEDLPPAEILIYAAGTIDESEAIDVNLEASIHLHEQLSKSKSLRSVLFIASASARNGSEFPYYVASKAGLVGYMKQQALSLAKRGVTCNSISPGGVVTDLNRHILDSEELYRAVKAETLLGKWAEPREIAELAYFMTVINRSITGEDILIDNGEMLKSNFIW